MVKQILVVDDTPDDLGAMKNILRKEGYRVETAMNEEETLEKIGKNTFDLVLLDILMPVSGYKLFKAIRKKVSSGSKIVCASIVPRQDVDMNNIDGFIQKPFSNEDFIGSVKSILK